MHLAWSTLFEAGGASLPPFIFGLYGGSLFLIDLATPGSVTGVRRILTMSGFVPV